MSKSGGWLDVLGPAIGAVAGMMVVAGIYLLDPAVADFGFALTAERTWLAGAFMIVVGLAFAFKLVRPKGLNSGSAIVDLLGGMVLGDLSHFFYGFIAGAIGLQALFAEPANYWAALLLVPSLLSFAIAFSEDDDENDAEDETEDDEAEEDDGADSGESESGGGVLWGIGALALRLSGFLVLYMAAFFAWLGLAIWAYTNLRRSIFDGEAPSVVAGWELSVNALLAAAPIAVAVILVLTGILFVAMYPWRSGQAEPSGEPAPLPERDRFIETSERAVRDYAVAQGYDRNNSHWELFELVSVLVMTGVGAIVAIGGAAILERAPEGPSFPIVVSAGGASAVVALFAFIVLSILPKSIWSRLSRRFSERAGWVQLRPKKNPGALSAKLIAFVRAGRLSTTAPIKPGDFLHAANLSGERYYFIAAGVLIAVSLFLLYRDLNSADIVTADAIEITDYWTLETKRYAYSDVAKVELRCFLTDKGEPVEAYVLHFRDGQSLDIFGKQVEEKIAAYEAIDAKLVALGVPFVRGNHQGWFKRDQPGYDPSCVDVLAEEFPEALRPRVKQLFHPDAVAADSGATR
jgi:hypothetical protein